MTDQFVRKVMAAANTKAEQSAMNIGSLRAQANLCNELGHQVKVYTMTSDEMKQVVTGMRNCYFPCTHAPDCP